MIVQEGNSRRAKLVFEPRDLHEALDLPHDVTVTGFYIDRDPDFLSVLLEGDRFDEVTENHESTVIRLSALRSQEI